MFKSVKLIVVVLLLIFIIASVSVFGAKNPRAREITVLAWDRGAVPPDQGTIEDNWYTREVNKRVAKLGIKVRWIPVPRAQESQKLPTMLAAGEAPDLCFTYDKFLLNTYIKNGALTDFTNLVNKYGHNIRKVNTQETMNAGKINGRIYSFVYRSVPTADTTWIRKDWLAKLGMKEPTNLDEFYNVLKAFKEKDPGKVGEKLVPLAFPNSRNYPFGIWYALVLPAFCKEAPSKDRLFEQVYPLWPETKEAMRFMNKLYNEKLLGEFILDKDGTLFRQKFVRGEIGANGHFWHWPYAAAFQNILDNLQKNVPGAQIGSISPWKGKSKENFLMFFRNKPYQYMWFSPKTAKYPDLVMKYLDWLASDEGVYLTWFGLKDIDYKIVDGLPTPVSDANNKQRVAWISGQYNSFRNPFVNTPDKFARNQALTFKEEYRPQFLKEAIYGSDKIKYSEPWLTSPTPTTDKLTPALQMKWEELQVKIITAPANEFDRVFDKAIKDYRQAGGDEVAKELAQAYHAQYGK